MTQLFSSELPSDVTPGCNSNSHTSGVPGLTISRGILESRFASEPATVRKNHLRHRKPPASYALEHSLYAKPAAMTHETRLNLLNNSNRNTALKVPSSSASSFFCSSGSTWFFLLNSSLVILPLA